MCMYVFGCLDAFVWNDENENGTKTLLININNHNLLNPFLLSVFVLWQHENILIKSHPKFNFVPCHSIDKNSVWLKDVKAATIKIRGKWWYFRNIIKTVSFLFPSDFFFLVFFFFFFRLLCLSSFILCFFILAFM